MMMRRQLERRRTPRRVVGRIRESVPRCTAVPLGLAQVPAAREAPSRSPTRDGRVPRSLVTSRERGGAVSDTSSKVCAATVSFHPPPTPNYLPATLFVVP